ncbi:Pectinesterase inhibitor, partial [Quillaja saponaria]
QAENMGSKTIVVLSAFVILLASFFLQLCNGIPQETLMQICFFTQSEETCEQILRSDPRTSSADLPLLSLISIEQTIKQAKENYDSFSQLHKSAGEAKVKDALTKCLTMYKTSIDKLN